MDADVQDFLERDGDLPKSSSTSALSGAGVMRLFHKMGDAVEKITFKMDESDEVGVDTLPNKLGSNVRRMSITL